MRPSSRSTERSEVDPLDEQSRQLAMLLGDLVCAIKQTGAPEDGVLGEAAARGHLGRRHYGVVARLVLLGELSVSELASRLGVTLTTASLLTAELSRAGLVERREDERDRRRTLVRVADAHRAEVEAWFDSRLGPLRRALETLGPTRRTALLDGIGALVAELRAPAASNSHVDGGTPAEPGVPTARAPRPPLRQIGTNS